MSDSAFEALSERLEGLGIYDISRESEIYSRLASMSEGIGLYREMLEEIFREMFVPTAENKGLEEYERMLAVINTDNTTEGRRKSIISALSINEKNGAEMILGGTGNIYNITGALTESGGALTFTTEDELSSEQAQLIEKHMRALMPVGIEFDLVVNE